MSIRTTLIKLSASSQTATFSHALKIVVKAIDLILPSMDLNLTNF
ncbi:MULTISPECIES: hypothetical protein [unclassified Microcoleus]|nr:MULTISPECIES: hypothetical protein [unclassified Microcoleus]